MSELAPVAPRERLVSLDVLRGLALCGVLIVNTSVAFNWRLTGGSTPVGTLDIVAQWFLVVFVYSKAQTTLCLLFGLGFAMQLLRADERGEPVTAVYARRLAALLVFGALHTAVWWGDVTWNYAVAGVGLFPFIRVSNRARLIWALSFVFVPHLITAIPPIGEATMRVFIDPAAQEAATARFAAALHGPHYAGLWWEHLRFSLIFITDVYAWYFFWVLGLFVLGYVAGKQRLFERDGADQLPVFRRLAWWGGAIGVVSNALVVATGLKWLSLGSGALWGRLTMVAVRELSLLSTALCYVGIVVLMLQRARWRRVLAVLAPVGRMPLTTYFTQSLVCTFLFYGWGLGWAGRTGLAGSIGIALVIFSAQVVAARLWLRRFRFGPLDWLWRAAVYWKLPAMRIVPATEPPRPPDAAAAEPGPPAGVAEPDPRAP